MKIRLNWWVLVPFAMYMALLATQVHAQQANMSVLATCGTASYVAGRAYPPTQNTTGLACGSATVVPSGTQDVNVTKVNGNTALAGAGVAGTGSLRTTQAQDTTTIAGSAPGTAGTASANVVTVQGIASGTSVAVSQATGTNLHAVLDTTSTTAVTQATGTNLHAVLDTTSTTAVTQATGTNLHAVLDTTSTTAVTQATAANLNATIVGAGSTATPGAGILPVVPLASAAATAGVVPVVSSSVETGHVIKAGAGNLYDFNVSADSTLSAAAWWVMIFNSTTVPAAGAVTPVKCYAMPLGATTISAAFPTPLYLSTGISMAVSTNGCFTKADSAHGFISADAQ